MDDVFERIKSNHNTANQFIYCTVDSDNKHIVWTMGSKKQKYFESEEYLSYLVNCHNQVYKDDLWHIKKYRLIEANNMD